MNNHPTLNHNSSLSLFYIKEYAIEYSSNKLKEILENWGKSMKLIDIKKSKAKIMVGIEPTIWPNI